MTTHLEIFLTFAYLGLTSVGGAWAVLPEMQRQVVEVNHWVSDGAFADAYALGQLAPGPNMFHVLAIGYQVEGLSGALAAGLGMIAPTAVLLCGVAWWVGRPDAPRWLQWVNERLAPVTLGLMLSAAWSLGLGSIHSVLTLAIALIAAIAVARQWLCTSSTILLAAGMGVAARMLVTA
jgi:chromate transporter